MNAGKAPAKTRPSLGKNQDQLRQKTWTCPYKNMDKLLAKPGRALANKPEEAKKDLKSPVRKACQDPSKKPGQAPAKKTGQNP